MNTVEKLLSDHHLRVFKGKLVVILAQAMFAFMIVEVFLRFVYR